MNLRVLNSGISSAAARHKEPWHGSLAPSLSKSQRPPVKSKLGARWLLQVGGVQWVQSWSHGDFIRNPTKGTKIISWILWFYLYHTITDHMSWLYNIICIYIHTTYTYIIIYIYIISFWDVIFWVLLGWFHGTNPTLCLCCAPRNPCPAAKVTAIAPAPQRRKITYSWNREGTRCEFCKPAWIQEVVMVMVDNGW